MLIHIYLWDIDEFLKYHNLLQNNKNVVKSWLNGKEYKINVCWDFLFVFVLFCFVFCKINDRFYKWNKRNVLLLLFCSYQWGEKPLVKVLFNSSQLAKMKKYIPYMSLPWNLQGRSSGSISFQLCFKNHNSCEYVKFGAILWKIDNLLITT